MTLDEAIEILTIWQDDPRQFQHPKYCEAVCLGIEALKEVREARLMGSRLPNTLLLGETRE